MASQASKRRISLAAAWTLVALVAGAAPSAASAAGHTYTVLQCHPLNRAHADAILEDAPAYATRGFCGDPQNDYAIKVTSTGDRRITTMATVTMAPWDSFWGARYARIMDPFGHSWSFAHALPAKG